MFFFLSDVVILTKLYEVEVRKFKVLHWCKMVWPCSKNGRRKIAQNSIEVDAKTKQSTRKTKKNWMEGIKKVMNERNLNEGQWEDKKQWSLGVGQRRKTFWTRHIHTYIDVRPVGLTRYLFLSVKWTVTMLIVTLCILARLMPYYFQNLIYAFIFRREPAVDNPDFSCCVLIINL